MCPPPPVLLELSDLETARGIASELAQRNTVFLVEDDDLVAGLVVRILARVGIPILRARNGAEAELLFSENQASISLAMLDCWLPDTSGTTLAHRLRRYTPALPVLLTSGHDQAGVDLLAEKGPTAFISKPYYPAELQQAVSDLMAVSR